MHDDRFLVLANGSEYQSVLVLKVRISHAKPIGKTVLAKYVPRDLACGFGKSHSIPVIKTGFDEFLPNPSRRELSLHR